MDFIKRIVKPEDVVESLIFSFREEISRKNDPNRYTKFDSDNDIFLGTLGEKVFFEYLESIGYLYKKDFIDNKCLDEKDFTKINGKIYDHFDFGLLYGKSVISIDVKTQYCCNLSLYNEEWQMAVNSKTIEKIINNKRSLDFFVFLFSDKKFEDYKTHIYKKCGKKNIEAGLKWLEEIKNSASNFFNPITLDIVGIIKSRQFIESSTLFKKNDLFRINFKESGEANFWKSDADMYRLFIRNLTRIEKTIIPKDLTNINIEGKQIFSNLNKTDKQNFKIWFESIFKTDDDLDNIQINLGDNIYLNIKYPLSNYFEGMQYKTFLNFFTEFLNQFRKHQ